MKPVKSVLWGEKMKKITVKIADQKEREEIYKYRYKIYSLELKQHKENPEKMLKDAIDEINTYIIVKINDNIAGFVSITPPGGKYGLDKYIDRTEFPYIYDNMFEGRLFSVLEEFRGTNTAMLLFFAILRYVEENGGTKIMTIGRSDLVEFYEKTGLKNLDRSIQSGEVTFKLLYAEVKDIRKKAATVYEKMLSRITANIDWQLDFPMISNKVCFHGGEYINNSLEVLENPEKLKEIITADVLDAWFPPSSKVIDVLNKNLSLLIKTSPPVNGKFIEEKIARVRNIPKENVLVGSGSSDLIFLSFLNLLNEKSKVLLLDPCYGEYAHILKNVIKCGFDRFILEENDNFCVDIDKFSQILTKNYDMVVIINPNNPTGNLIDKDSLKNIIEKTNKNTIFWIDETYIDYIGKSNSLEELTKTHKNIIICKSLSKIFAFSGIRAAYLCSSPQIISKLRNITPPWQLSFLSQVAIFNALDDYSYYEQKYIETSILKEDFVSELSKINNIKVISHGANFIFCKILDEKTKSIDLINYCKNYNLYLRDVTNMGTNFHGKFFRIAVKDKDANKKMIEIIKEFSI